MLDLISSTGFWVCAFVVAFSAFVASKVSLIRERKRLTRSFEQEFLAVEHGAEIAGTFRVLANGSPYKVTGERAPEGFVVVVSLAGETKTEIINLVFEGDSVYETGESGRCWQNFHEYRLPVLCHKVRNGK